jgi:peroxiredoxin Q/BCP
MPAEGSLAPPFSLPDQDGNTVSLTDLSGKWVVLWWYPKAATTGCTLEGQGFRDRSPEYEAQGAVIVGASFDTPVENKAFANSQGFPYRLLADEDRSVGEAYEVKKAADEQYIDFPRRRSFLIDPDGVLRKAYDVTDVATHPQQVLDDLIALKG